MIKLSATIITFNEERNLARCLESLKGIVDEIVVVDSFSTDGTEAIAVRYGARFIKHAFAGHIEQKNVALDTAAYDHILSLDADEALDDRLRHEILEIKKGFDADGYAMNRLTRYGEHWVRYCGWHPDWKLRLFDRRKARWAGVNPHDIVHMAPGTKVERLDGLLLHYSYSSIAEHVRQTNTFTTIAAQAAYDRGVRSSLFKIATRPPLKFFRDYLLLRGFLDGLPGLVICCINALSALLKYSKLKELQDARARG